jgi:hypothetical protein
MSDFENISVFKPADYHEDNVNTMLDQVLSWSGALKTVRLGILKQTPVVYI